MSSEKDIELEEMHVRKSLVFLIDADNTLLNNNQILYELGQLLYTDFGSESATHYWDIVEQLRVESVDLFRSCSSELRRVCDAGPGNDRDAYV